jgi:hypothetical protein
MMRVDTQYGYINGVNDECLIISSKKLLSEYAGLSRLMQLGEDDPDMQFYAEALKP